MTRKFYRDVGSSLLVGVGIIVSTLVAARTAQSGWLVMAGPLVLALVFISADALNSRLRGKSSGPSPVALISGGTCLLAALIVMSRDPGLVKTIIPIVGMTGWVSLRLRDEDGRNTCRCI